MSNAIRDNLKRLLAPRHLAFIGGRSMARALKRCADGGAAPTTTRAFLFTFQ